MKRRIFPEAFKREAVERAVTSGSAVGKIAGELGLVDSVLRRWMRELGAKASARPPRLRAPALTLLPADLASENARLRRENDRLRMERKILKKPSPFLGGLEVNGKKTFRPMHDASAGLTLALTRRYRNVGRVDVSADNFHTLGNVRGVWCISCNAFYEEGDL